MQIITKSRLNRNGNFNIMDYISFLSIVLLIVVFASINPNFVSAFNVRNLLADIGPLLIIACGVTFVLLTGSIDLSIGSVCSCSAIIFTVLLPVAGNFAYVGALIYGLIAGIINGLVYTKVRIPSFIATLGAMSVWQSAAYLLSNGTPMQIPKAFWGNIGWVNIKFGILSVPLFVSLFILAVFYTVQTRTKLGKQAFAIGANERAARIAGINVGMVKTGVFAICGLCSAMSGVFLVAKLKSGIPIVGDPFTLMGVAAVVLGGTALSGGKGGVIGTLLGSALVLVIQNGMNITGINPFWQQIVFGSLVIGAVYMTVDRSGRNVIIK